MTRPDPLPAQVAAASGHLRSHLLGAGVLGSFEPASAAAAVAPFLLTAARAAARAARMVDPAAVFAESDNIRSTAVEVPELVVRRLAAGERAEDVVADLIAEGQAVAEGRVFDVATLDERLAQGSDRMAVLDPARPALDLLEELLSGLKACATLADDGSWYRTGEVEPGEETTDDVVQSEAHAAWFGAWWATVVDATPVVSRGRVAATLR